jgi:23S rRNA (pseudouridine1915-N3)-methyltransferase
MRYRIVAVGRVKDAGVRSACDEYVKRLQHYTKVEEIEVKDEARILGSIPEGSRLVALSRAGDAWTSRMLAERTAEWEMEGRDVGFAIGGAEALPAGVLDRADSTWSLSALTMPHEMARLIVLEQLYRAHTIRRGEPYHRGP